MNDKVQNIMHKEWLQLINNTLDLKAKREKDIKDISSLEVGVNPREWPEMEEVSGKRWLVENLNESSVSFYSAKIIPDVFYNGQQLFVEDGKKYLHTGDYREW